MPYGVVPYGVDLYGNPDNPVAGDVIEVELPGVYVDALTFDEATEGLLLVNQAPEKGSTQNPINTNIDFEVFETSGANVDVATLVVTVGGETVYESGSFAAGWDGPGSAVTDNGNVVHVTIDPTTDFESEQIVVVNVVVSNDTGTHTLNETYAFKIEDITAPKLLAALALDQTTVRVTFDEPMLALDPAGAADALNPANYSFATTHQPAVPLVCVGVTKVTSAVYDLETDIEMTGNVLYTVTAANVSDLFDNVIAPPDDTAEFIGFACPAPADRDFQLWNWVPIINKREDESVGDLAKLIACFQEVTDLLLCLIDRFANIIDIDKAPETFLDAILVDLGNPFYWTLTLLEKRRLAHALVTMYKQKGTKQGLINAIRMLLNIEVEIEVLNSFEAWMLGEDELGEGTFLGPSDQALLYSFRIIAPFVLTDTERERMTTIANYMKVAHEHLIEIVEPEAPLVIDHWELGLSLLGDESDLH